MEKKVPQRKCVGCRNSYPKRSLIRIVKEQEGNITVDKTGKKNGRGAYICKNAECLKIAFNKKQLDYSFKCKVDSAIYESLLKEFSEYEN